MIDIRDSSPCKLIFDSAVMQIEFEGDMMFVGKWGKKEVDQIDLRTLRKVTSY